MHPHLHPLPSKERMFRSNALPMKTIRAAILVIVVLALVAGPARAEKIRTAIPQANLNYLSIFIADAKDSFAMRDWTTRQWSFQDPYR